MKKNLLFLTLFFSFTFSFAQPDTLTCNVYGNPDAFPEYFGTNWLINSDIQDYSGCGTYYTDIQVCIIDTATCEAWGTYNCSIPTGSCGSCTMVNSNHRFGNLNDSCGVCRNRVEKYFTFRINDPGMPEQLFYLDTLLRNDTLGGVYFLIYTWMNIDRDYIMNVNPNVYGALSDLGATNALIQADSVPFIFFARADDPSSAIEVIGDSATAFITLQTVICNSAISEISIEEKKNDFTIFPNPATDMLTIEYNREESAEIIFYDITGRKVMETGIGSGEHQKINIDISVLPRGLYHVIITGKNNFSVMKKIIITR